MHMHMPKFTWTCVLDFNREKKKWNNGRKKLKLKHKEMLCAEKCGDALTKHQRTTTFHIDTRASAFYRIIVMDAIFDICSSEERIRVVLAWVCSLKVIGWESRGAQQYEFYLRTKTQRTNRFLVYLREFHCIYAYLRRCSTNPRD